MFNIYDFDGTIYDGDSTLDFYFYCLRKKTSIIIYLPLFLIYALLYFLGIVSKTTMKEKFYRFLTRIDDVDLLVNKFWEKNDKNIKEFYLEKNHKNDIIISASPYFLLKPICDKLKVKKLMASNVNKKTGIYDGLNCSGEEKVRRLNEEFPNIKVNEVYSDSYNDIPIFKLGKKAFLVKKNSISLLERIKDKKKKRAKYKYLLEFLFVISCICLSLLLVGEYKLVLFKFLIFLIIIVASYFVYLLRDIIYVDFKKKIYLISVVISLYFISNVNQYTSHGILYLEHLFKRILGITLAPNVGNLIVSIGSIFSFSILIYYFIVKFFSSIKEFFLGLDKIEKRLLTVLVVGGLIVTFILYNSTTIFYRPFYKKVQFTPYDVLYTTDSGALVEANAFMNVGTSENDIRQPLFGFCAIPFSMAAKFISSFLDFVPNSYYIIFATIQLFLLGICLILISRMLELKNSKIYFYVLSCSTYTMFVFPFVFEQYVILLFYLILAIYIGYNHVMEVNYFYCSAVGTLITSGIIFPLISRFKRFKYWISNICKCFFMYMFLMAISGQFLLVFYFKSRIDFLMKFSGKDILFKDRLLQFLYFVRSIFITPATRVVIEKSVHRFWLCPTNAISVLGIIILLLCFISFIINRKNRFALLSFLWVIFSFLILCVFGWGTQENGLILYSLYFSWAYCSLIVLLFDKIKNSKIRYWLFVVIVAIMVYINFNGLMAVLNYGIKYFGL